MIENNTLKKRLLLVFKLVLSACAIFIIFKKIDLAMVGHYLSSASLPWVFASFAVFFLSKATSAVRLNLFFKCIGVTLSEKKNLYLYLYGMFYNLFVPFIGGEAYKIYWINKQQQTPVKLLLWASLNDRLSGLVWLSVFAILFFMLSPIAIPYKPFVWVLIPLGIAVYYLVLRIFFSEYLPVFIASNLFSIVVQATQILCSYFVLQSLGVQSHVADYLFIFILSCYAYMIPFMGAREMAFVFGAEAFGLDINLSLAISLFFYATMAVSSLTGVVFLFFPSLLNEE